MSFWLLGLLNNSCYVIMIAGANAISSGAVGLVYLCAVLPGILMKASAPYWFHLVPYWIRVIACGGLMVSSFVTVALSGKRGLQLVGVVFAALQSSLGEASCLALSSHFESRLAITMWSSGTGFAGVFGYMWVAVLHVMLGFSFKTTLLLALVLPMCWILVYFVLLESPDGRRRELKALFTSDSVLANAAREAFTLQDVEDEDDRALLAYDDSQLASHNDDDVVNHTMANMYDGEYESGCNSPSQQHKNSYDDGSQMMLTHWERFQLVLGLWKYTIPLFTVYFAEYAMQSGVWPSIGFPVEEETSRHTFYVYSNWAYQAGVFVSRSSGTLWQASHAMLWAMPVMQFCFMVFFILTSMFKFWYSWSLLVPCLCTGLLGGAVYVNAFTLISQDVMPQHKELSLAAASVADSSGIAIADVAGILIQGCLFKWNNLPGADFTC